MRSIVICSGIWGRGRWSDRDAWDDWRGGRCDICSTAGLSSEVVEICTLDFVVDVGGVG